MKNLIYIFAIAVCFASCNMADNSASMKPTAIQEQMQKFYDQVINAHNPAAMDSFCTADFLDHNPDQGHTGKGIDDAKASFTEFFAAFPDVHITANFFVESEDKCAAHVTMTGTNSGMMGNMPATNKQVTVDGIDLIKVKDGKATERWGFFDTMKMMTDLGLMPAPGAMPDSAAMMEKMGMEKK